MKIPMNNGIIGQISAKETTAEEAGDSICAGNNSKISTNSKLA
jgi:hypothetical protein